MGTFIVLVILCVVVGLIIRSMMKDHKAGKSIQCGCGCSSCNGSCHTELKEKIDRLRNAA